MRSCSFLVLALLTPSAWGDDAYPPPAEVRAAFLKLLDRPKVPADARQVSVKPATRAAWVLEQTTIASEQKRDGTTERVPILMLRGPASAKPRPAVIVLHGTGGSKEGMLPFLSELAERDIIGVAVDARYHGGRAGGAKGAAAYNEAIVRAWKAKAQEMEHPFYYDTCWDLWRVADYLATRPEIDAGRLGMIGFSMGGIQTWLAASVDERIRVVVPAIAVQSFRWSLDHDAWQGRARTIKLAHDAAAQDLGEPAVNAKVAEALWRKIVPGIVDRFDCPSMMRLFAGRPLLIVSGTKDANCPYGGAKLAIAAAERAYAEAKAGDRLKVMIAEVGHTVTAEQRQAALAWFEQWLVKDAPR